MAAEHGRLSDWADIASLEAGRVVPRVPAERIEVLRTRYRTQRFPRHSHDTYTVGVGLSGVGSIWYRGAEHARRPGEAVVIPPGEVHTGGITPRSTMLSYMAVYLPASVIAACAEAEEIGNVEPGDAHTPIVRDRDLSSALLRLHDVLWPAGGGRVSASPHAASVMAAEDELHLAIAALLRHRSRYRRDVLGPEIVNDPQLVRRVRAILQDCYSEHTRTSLRALATETGVTPSHLVRAFTHATGMSPHHYLLQVRVRHARHLLATGNAPSVVAAMVGFTDQSHLTLQFHRYVGITPARYQRGVMRSAVARSGAGPSL